MSDSLSLPLTPELKTRLLSTWGQRSRLRAAELLQSELAISQVEAEHIIQTLEPEYLRSIGQRAHHPDSESGFLALFQYSFDFILVLAIPPLALVGLLFYLGGVSPQLLFFCLMSVIVVWSLAFSIGKGM